MLNQKKKPLIAVVRYRILFLGMESWKWALCINPLEFDKNAKNLTRHEALDLIQKHGLERKYDSVDGQIYTTDEFYETWKGCFLRNILS